MGHKTSAPVDEESIDLAWGFIQSWYQLETDNSIRPNGRTISHVRQREEHSRSHDERRVVLRRLD